MPPSNLLAVLQTNSDAKNNTEDRQDSHSRTPLFRVAKCIAIPPSTEAFVSVTTSRAKLTYMVPHLSSMRNQIVQSATWIINTATHTNRTTSCDSHKKANKISERCFIRGRTLISRRYYSFFPNCNQPNQNGEKDDNSIIHTGTAVHYNGCDWQYDLMDGHKRFETVDDKGLSTDWQNTSTLMYSMPITLEKFWTRWLDVNKFEMDVWAELIWSSTTSNWPHRAYALSTLSPTALDQMRTHRKGLEQTKCSAWTFQSVHSQSWQCRPYFPRTTTDHYASVTTTES